MKLFLFDLFKMYLYMYLLCSHIFIFIFIYYSEPFTVLIISGHSGCRGTTFKDRDHCTIPKSAMHLTDFYFSVADSASGENIVQTAGVVQLMRATKNTMAWVVGQTNGSEFALGG